MRFWRNAVSSGIKRKCTLEQVLHIFKGFCTTACFGWSALLSGYKLERGASILVNFHLIRHWKGTMEYHKTHDIDHVRGLLGHRSVLPTQLYVNMEQALFAGNVNEYYVKAVSTVEEATALLEVGFEYVTEIDGKKLFRKRK